MKADGGRAILYLSLSLMLGCGSAGQTGKLTGKVTFEGEPVTEGAVLFVSDSASSVGQTNLLSDGSYRFEIGKDGLMPGDYAVAILPPMIRTPDTPTSPGGEEPKPVENIPQKYRSTTRSGLTTQVTTGDNVFNVEMKK